MRTQQISSFADIQAAMENFGRADAALAGGVARGNTQGFDPPFGQEPTPCRRRTTQASIYFCRPWSMKTGRKWFPSY